MCYGIGISISCIDIEQKRPNPIRAAKGKNTKLVLLNYAKLHHQQWWLLPNVMKKLQCYTVQLHQLSLIEICKFLDTLMTFCWTQVWLLVNLQSGQSWGLQNWPICFIICMLNIILILMVFCDFGDIWFNFTKTCVLNVYMTKDVVN